MELTPTNERARDKRSHFSINMQILTITTEAVRDIKTPTKKGEMKNIFPIEKKTPHRSKDIHTIAARSTEYHFVKKSINRVSLTA